MSKTNVVRLSHSGIPKIVSLLDDCSMSGAELARRVGVFPSTVSAWTTGKHETPGAVIAYLDLLSKVRALVQ